MPSRIAALPHDARGYYVPVMVYRDPEGRPHFQINDHDQRLRVIFEDLCSICGGKLTRGRWFVGGPASAFHAHGAYIDPPMHGECARYALQVCPYLAAPTYAKRIDGRTLKPDQRDALLLLDPTQDPDRPPVFVAVMALATEIIEGGEKVKPARPYRRIEYWRAGARLTGEDWVEADKLRHAYG